MKQFLNLIVLIIAALATTVPMFAADGPTGDSQPVININTASVEQLMLLPRIGEKTASQIVAWREQNGAFKKATDILQVKGIGDKSFELLKPYIVLEGKTTLSVKQRVSRKSKPTNA
ncbi:MAG: helix-hairpin-helix domain-containing protein, partial [Thermoanaerobaculia bacterium]|nr:helix-hairpin-helix domain-containing protein [Thermoanaerobaculia bacterium]